MDDLSVEVGHSNGAYYKVSAKQKQELVIFFIKIILFLLGIFV
jgi:hypothetical protein